MSEYTKKGHALKHVEGLVFECANRMFAGWDDQENKLVSGGRFILARMIIFAPCTQGQMVSTLRAWLTAYDDEELLAQVEEVVRQAIDKLPPPASPPPEGPQGKQGLN